MWIKANKRIGKLIIAGCVIGLVSGCSLIPKEEEILKPPLVKPEKVTYETYEVKRGDISRTIKGIGTYESSNVKSHEFDGANGKVVSIHVKLGDTVKKGDVLMELDVDGLQINLKERERDLEQAKAALEEAKKSQDVNKMKIRMMELEIAQMKLDEANRLIKGKTLTAQIDGVVTFVDLIKPGESVQADKSYVNIADPNNLRLAYQVTSPSDIQDVQVGMKADVTFNGNKVEGTVVQTPTSAPVTDNKQLSDKYSRTLYVETKQLPPQATIGSAAEILITTQGRKNTIKIPTRGLNSYLGRNYVKVLDGESVTEVDVEKGIESSTEVEILQGLNEGQNVILQ